MRKILFLLSFIFALVSPVLAQTTQFSGTLTVSHGWVRNLDGTYRSIKGLRLPFVAERIYARPIHLIKPQPGGSGGGEDSTTVYNADAGSDYGIIEDPDPSSLDDMVLNAGAGAPWENLTFGVDIMDQRSFLIRWRCYSTHTPGLPAGVHAFSNEFADFGVIIPSSLAAVGTWKFTISVVAAGVVSPNNTMFMAQQFRTPQPDGNGPFDASMRNVYNPSAPPTTGTSENVFWYDWDPRNGQYADDEMDNFGENTFANLLRTITTSGAQDTLVPFDLTLLQGTHISGSLVNVWQSDDGYYRARPKYDVPRNVAPLQIEITSQATANTITSLKFSLEAGADTGGGSQTIELFNYQTNAYELVDTRTITAADSVADVLITSNPSRFVKPGSDRFVKAKISFFPPLDAARTWGARIDRTVWFVTRP